MVAGLPCEGAANYSRLAIGADYLHRFSPVHDGQGRGVRLVGMGTQDAGGRVIIGAALRGLPSGAEVFGGDQKLRFRQPFEKNEKQAEGVLPVIVAGELADFR